MRPNSCALYRDKIRTKLRPSAGCSQIAGPGAASCHSHAFGRGNSRSPASGHGIRRKWGAGGLRILEQSTKRGIKGVSPPRLKGPPPTARRSGCNLRIASVSFGLCRHTAHSLQARSPQRGPVLRCFARCAECPLWLEPALAHLVQAAQHQRAAIRERRVLSHAQPALSDSPARFCGPRSYPLL